MELTTMPEKKYCINLIFATTRRSSLQLVQTSLCQSLSKPWRNHYTNRHKNQRENQHKNQRKNQRIFPQDSLRIDKPLYRRKAIRSESYGIDNYARKCRLILAESSFCRKKRLFIFSDFFRFFRFLVKKCIYYPYCFAPKLFFIKRVGDFRPNTPTFPGFAPQIPQFSWDLPPKNIFFCHFLGTLSSKNGAFWPKMNS